MKVPLLDLGAQLEAIHGEIKEAICEVLDSTRYVMGPKVEQLEQEIAEYVGSADGIGVSSGTDALLVSLMALDVGPDDVVLTTPYSFFATAGAVARLGARPAFVDIDPATFNIDPKLLRAWFEDAGNNVEKVKAIVPVHLYGQCCDMGPILQVASEYNIPIIEDAAQAIGAACSIDGGTKRAGAIGDLGCFSFFPSKNLGGIGDGGMVTTSNVELAEKLRKLRNHGAAPKYYHKMIGGNFRLDPIQAAALLVKLKYLDSWHKGRQSNAEYYDRELSGLPIRTPQIAEDRKHHIYNQYKISVPEKRDELRAFLSEREIGTEVYYPVPFHLQECFLYLGYKKGDFPNSELAANETIALPIYSELTEEMQAFVVSSIKEFFG